MKNRNNQAVLDILKKEFGKIDGVVRAKRKPYIPVVLSREEIDLIIEKLRYPFNLNVMQQTNEFLLFL